MRRDTTEDTLAVAGAGRGAATRRGRRHAHTARRAKLMVLAVVLPVMLAAIVTMVATWPPSAGHAAAQAGLVDTGMQYYRATVTSALSTTCQGSQENAQPDGTVPATVPCVRVTARVTEGPSVGAVITVYPTVGTPDRDVRPGADIVVQHYPASGGSSETWAFADVERTVPLATLAMAFLLVTAVVAGWRGFRALIGLAVAMVLLWVYLLPGLIAGQNAMVLSLTSSVVIMTVVGYLTHGLSLRTSTALLGTFFGLGLIGGLGVFGAWAAGLNPVTSEQDYQLAELLGTHGLAALHGIFLAGVVLAGLGVLNDVTITQVSAVWELRTANRAATWQALFAGGMRIGRDHVASTIYTIAFAYVGASLPVLLTLQLYGLPLARTLTGGAFAQEIVRTLAGSIGLVLAIPLTTVAAAVVATHCDPAALRAGSGHSHPAPA